MFLNVTYNFIASHQCFDVIYLAPETRAAGSLLPTWCPDWTNLKGQVSLDVVWAFQEVDEVHLANWGTFVDNRWTTSTMPENRSRLGGHLPFRSRALNDVRVAGHMNTPTRYQDSRFLHCNGSLLGFLSAIQEDNLHDEVDVWDWQDKDPVWAVRWYLRGEVYFNEAMIVPRPGMFHAFIPSPWRDGRPGVRDSDEALSKARTECTDVRDTIKSAPPIFKP